MPGAQTLTSPQGGHPILRNGPRRAGGGAGMGDVIAVGLLLLTFGLLAKAADWFGTW